MFTRQHYVKLAASLKQGTEFAVYADQYAARSQHALQCNTIALMLQEDNPSFVRNKFLRSCGLSDEDIEAL